MGNKGKGLCSKAETLFKKHFGCGHKISAYAPGRIEVLGNHTDYNDGFVLSAAIDMGTVFLVKASADKTCRLLACDSREEAKFDVNNLSPSRDYPWANYVKGVLAGLRERGSIPHGFIASITRDIPLGSGLSSSAALEIASGLAFSEIYGIRIDKLDLAKIGQKAEHEYAGVKCGLLDQISSLYGQAGSLVMTDFRSLDVKNVRLGGEICFLMCDTKTKHALVDGAYNERRAHCEAAARAFGRLLDHPVSALRDVSWREWERYSPQMDKLTARRAAHPVGENERVARGMGLLSSGKVVEFGKLMFDSHESSRVYFENSCRELDFVVAAAREVSGVLGARLSGGGFGGSAVLLVDSREVETVSRAIARAFAKEFGRDCDVRTVEPSEGARVMENNGGAR